jgi:hypothetical protein
LTGEEIVEETKKQAVKAWGKILPFGAQVIASAAAYSVGLTATQVSQQWHPMHILLQHVAGVVAWRLGACVGTNVRLALLMCQSLQYAVSNPLAIRGVQVGKTHLAAPAHHAMTAPVPQHMLLLSCWAHVNNALYPFSRLFVLQLVGFVLKISCATPVLGPTMGLVGVGLANVLAGQASKHTRKMVVTRSHPLQPGFWEAPNPEDLVLDAVMGACIFKVIGRQRLSKRQHIEQRACRQCIVHSCAVPLHSQKLCTPPLGQPHQPEP